jgi:squalene-hopene/tetraprenyl-beta-curcumene cyclase
MTMRGYATVAILMPLTLSAQTITHLPASAPADPPRLATALPPADAEVRQRASELLRRGAQYLLAAQKDDGWDIDKGPGITALAATALARDSRIGPQHAAVRRAVQAVLKSRRGDGGVYSALGLHKNYETSVVISMLTVMEEKESAEAIQAAQKFLIERQLDDGDGKSVDDAEYGGWGYGLLGRADLSNTQMMLDALHDSGLPKDHPAYAKALAFVARCQMNGETNDREFARGSSTGGFIYSAASGGLSKAGKEEINGYGSMTYAGFKSLIYCGLTRNDPRVKAALDWMTRHWTLDRNPNMPDKQSREGIYYYYLALARALAAHGEPEIRDAVGRRHDWRAELVKKLAELQQPDGSWVNTEDRWMEGLPALTTAYAMLALHAAVPEAARE